MAVRGAGRGTASPWDVTPRSDPSQWFPDNWRGEGCGHRAAASTGTSDGNYGTLRSACIGGQTSVKVWKQSAQTRLHPTSHNGVASLIQTYTAKGPSEVGPRGPNLAGPTPSSKGLTLNELLTTKDSKGFSKKCNFCLGSKVLPKRDITASPFHSFGTSKGQGTTDVQHGSLN